MKDLFYAMVDLDITSEEMWHAADYLKEVGQNNEWGLLYAGLGIERFIDAMSEHADEEAGLKGETPRTETHSHNDAYGKKRRSENCSDL